MGYSNKGRANKRPREEADTELVTELIYLRETIDLLETTLTQACEAIEQVAYLLHDALHPTQFPEPLRDGPPPPPQELSSNGLVDFSYQEEDVPF